MSDVMNVCVNINAGTLAVGTTNVVAFWAPTDAIGGGLTVTDVRYSSNAAIAAGSAPNFTLVTLGTNSATNGTIASAIGSAAFTAGTSRVGTISDAWVDGTEGVAVQWAQTAANADSPTITAHIQYKMGR
jgi:hypothetical protein